MNFKNRIEELNTNLVLTETKILVVLEELEELIFNHDEESSIKFILSLNNLQHLKNEYHIIYIQLKTLTAYKSEVKT